MLPFSLDTEDSLILVPTFVEDEEVSLVLDTGARVLYVGRNPKNK